jgi:isoquinoline 1-oxidoreductase alpha subunit
MITLDINGQQHNVEVAADTPLLWVLRDTLHLTGTKFGCGIAQCGACTVFMNGSPIRSCSVPASSLVGQKITTIENVAADATGKAVQVAWVAESVPQCGYCQSGQVMAATALLKNKPRPTDAEIDAAMTNICRCGTYPRIRAAIHRAAATLVTNA